ncbi:MAG: hypothetical protein R3C14_54065 [Caldilineaceae bacterium]
MTVRAKIYWIGGSPCAGKSTIAQQLAAAYDLTYYPCDHHFSRHQQQARPTAEPTLSRLASLCCDEIWLVPVAEQVARVQAIYAEEFAMIWADLCALPQTRPILAEGAALMPALVQPHLAGPRQAIWITPTPTFQQQHYAQRTWVAHVLAKCTEPERAFQQWVARDIAFAQIVNEQADALGLQRLQVDGQRSLAENRTTVARWFNFVQSIIRC